jgi:hypothetical protein
MKIRQKQVAAALAAVDLYLWEEAAQAAPAQAVPQRAVAEPGAWAMAGRLDMMSLRRLMQMRAVARLR